MPIDPNDLKDDINNTVTNEIEEGGIEATELGGLMISMVELTEEKVPGTRTVAGHALSANVTLVKADVGLANVDNTTDLNKPVSTAQQTALDAKISQGGNSYGAAMVIGAGDANELHLKTSNTVKAAIAANGLFRIGNGVTNLEELLELSRSGQTGKFYFGIGGGGGVLANTPFITGGANSFSAGATRIEFGTNVFKIVNSTYIELSNASPASTGTEVRGGLLGTAAGEVFGFTSRAQGTGGGHNPTAGTLTLFALPKSGATSMSFNPATNAAEFIALLIQPIINQTGTASGISRGIHINPTLTAAADWRGIEIANTTHWGMYNLASKNHINGKLLIGTTTDTGAKLQVDGDISLNSPGNKLKVKGGTNASAGTVALVAGTATVNTTAVTANSIIMLTSQVDGGTPDTVRVTAKTAGTSFVITSLSATDTSTVGWFIVDVQ